MKIEPVTFQDAEELLAIYAPYVRETAISFETEVPSVQDFRVRIVAVTVKFPWFKAVDENGQILGYCYAHTFIDRRAYDRTVETTVYVRRDVRGQGVGSALYTHLEECLRGMGVLNMTACIGCPRTDDDPYLTKASPHFHERMGFRPVGIFHEVGRKFGRWYDILWMEKSIAPHSDDPLPVRFGEWMEQGDCPETGSSFLSFDGNEQTA